MNGKRAGKTDLASLRKLPKDLYLHTREATACAAPRALGSTHRWRLLTCGRRWSCGLTLRQEQSNCALKIRMRAACRERHGCSGGIRRRRRAAACVRERETCSIGCLRLGPLGNRQTKLEISCVGIKISGELLHSEGPKKHLRRNYCFSVVIRALRAV